MCFCQAKGLLHTRVYPKLFAICTQPASASMAKYTGWGKRDPPPAHVPGGDPAPLRRLMGCVCRFCLHPQGLALASFSSFSLMGAAAVVTSVA